MKLFQTLFFTLVLMFSTAVFAEKVNINTASAEQISSVMTGIGSSKAEAIVKYRNTHGKFKSIQDLQNIAGIGEKTIEKNKDKVSL